MRLILQVPALDKFWLCARGVLYAFTYSVAFHLLLLPDIVSHEGALCVPMTFHETTYFSYIFIKFYFHFYLATTPYCRIVGRLYRELDTVPATGYTSFN